MEQEEQKNSKPVCEKYDRSLRLWGGHGQEKLMEAQILLIGGSPAGVETLKNLVLPRCGSIYIIDNKVITESDTSNNFFIPGDTVGENRSEVLVEWLLEMNPWNFDSETKRWDGVKGKGIVKDIATLQEEDFQPKFEYLKEINTHIKAEEDLPDVRNYDLVIINQQQEPVVKRLAGMCEELGIKYLIQRQYGLIGYLRAYSPEHTIIENKPLSYKKIRDMRLNKPFPGLLEYCNQFDMDALRAEIIQEYEEFKNAPDQDQMEEDQDQKKEVRVFTSQNHKKFRHIPYPVILLKELEKWKDAHDGNAPSTKPEKKAYRKQVKAFAIPGLREEEDNVKEAGAFKNQFQLFLTDDEIKGKVLSLMEEVEDKDMKTCSDFWNLVMALKLFWEIEKQLPLNGGLPDMTASTKYYQQLQQVYQAKAQSDKKKFVALLDTVLQDNPKVIQPKIINRFLKNLLTLNKVTYRKYGVQMEAPQNLDFHQMDDDKDIEAQCHLWYPSLVGHFQFEEKHGRYPGENDVDELYDLSWEYNNEFFQRFWKVNGHSARKAMKKMAEELCRYEGCVFAPTAALMGGVAAQEAIKLLTLQYTPLNNTLIYNGIHSEMDRFEF